MKCPNCGQWNRASFPRCFKCGTELPLEARAPLPAEELAAPREADTYIRVDELGNEKPDLDPKDRLAQEMQSYHERKRRGKIRQQKLREEGEPEWAAPSQTELQDGLKYRNRDRWVYVRVSATEPLIRVIAEAPSQGEADWLARDFMARIKRLV